MIPFGTHSTKNLRHLAILKKIQGFFRKKHLFFQKNPNFERFEKTLYSKRILQQIWYNLVKKNHVQKRERTSFWRECNWQASGKKTAPFWVNDFAPILYNMAQNKNCLFVAWQIFYWKADVIVTKYCALEYSWVLTGHLVADANLISSL